MRDSLCALSASAGYGVRDYSSAKAFLRDDSSVAHCLIADIRMPEMDGMELLAEVVKRECGLPVIMMTGHGDLLLASNAMKAGAIDFVEKPFQDDDFLERVDRALRINIRSRSDCEG